jgi:hypothetical protein
MAAVRANSSHDVGEQLGDPEIVLANDEMGFP